MIEKAEFTSSGVRSAETRIGSESEGREPVGVTSILLEHSPASPGTALVTWIWYRVPEARFEIVVSNAPERGAGTRADRGESEGRMVTLNGTNQKFSRKPRISCCSSLAQTCCQRRHGYQRERGRGVMGSSSKTRKKKTKAFVETPQHQP